MKAVDQSAGLFALHHVLAFNLDLSDWQRIAREVLPPRHPVHTKSNKIDDIRAALEALGPSEACLRKGRGTLQESFNNVLGNPQFSPDGRKIAALVHYEGQCTSGSEYDVEDEEADFCLTVTFEDGTKKLLLWTVAEAAELLDTIKWSAYGEYLMVLKDAPESRWQIYSASGQLLASGRCGDSELSSRFASPEVTMVGDGLVNSAPNGPLSYATCDPTGSKLLQMGRPRIQNGGRFSSHMHELRCAKLFTLK
ncbi:hypothetical protein WJX73_002074 [Symbiochloris irregularis]|uniref:Uncharacterized protein n=1 Tax=Symbiochloris irregularis TaxID=706552 RepID=A0AAW1PSN1_9CHLO